MKGSGYSYIFTLHFATINTDRPFIPNFIEEIFTLHFATINTSFEISSEELLKYLHYTLLLLILLYFKGLCDILIHLHYTLLLLIRGNIGIYRFHIVIYITLCYY